MKKFYLFTILFAILASSSYARVHDSFFFDPFLTVEYSAPRFYREANAKHFATDSLGSQLKNFDNLALGAHIRIRKNIGINLNWAQTDLASDKLGDTQLAKKANLAIDYTNLSAMAFKSLIGDHVLELFGEVGISKMKSKLTIFETNGNYTKKQSGQNSPFVGGGVQFAPFENSKDFFRLTFQYYLNKTDSINAHFSVIRFGYAKNF